MNYSTVNQATSDKSGTGRGARGTELRAQGAGHRAQSAGPRAVSYTHLRAHETVLVLVCRLLLAKKKDEYCIKS